MTYRPELDGLRGLAILLVLAGHTLPVVKDGGKTGVAVFFVLSGYLITTLLLQERAVRGRISLRRFYVRRARRLLPAQLVCTAVLGAVGLALGSGFLTVPQLVEAMLYVKNFRPNEGIFGHFWSLAVEEQFYIVWAPIVALVMRRWSARVVLMLAAFGAVGSWLLRMHFWAGWFGPISFEETLPLMSDAILIGAALAAFMHLRGRPTVGYAWAPFTAVLFGVVALLIPMRDAELHYVPIVALVTALVIYGARSTCWLSAGWLRWFGERSYAIYLWHYPIGLILFLFGIGWEIRAVIVIPSALIIAELSWRYVETRFRRRSTDQLSVTAPTTHPRPSGRWAVSSGATTG